MKPVCLGSAMWGWSVNESTAFELLDYFYDKGGRYVDSALNYPINNKPEDYGAASLIIGKWLKKNNVHDLKLMMKVGSLNNDNSPNNDLTPEALEKPVAQLIEVFGDNLYSLMIHWDNRDIQGDISNSLQYLQGVCEQINCRLGLSGVRYIDQYKSALLATEIKALDIQVKSNFLYQGETYYLPISEALVNYDIRIWGYGISGSGLKLDASEYKKDSYVSLVRSTDYHKKMLSVEQIKCMKTFIEQTPHVNNIYHISILIAENNPSLYGYMISPSKVSQLSDSINFRKNIEQYKLQINTTVVP